MSLRRPNTVVCVQGLTITLLACTQDHIKIHICTYQDGPYYGPTRPGHEALSPNTLPISQHRFLAIPFQSPAFLSSHRGLVPLSLPHPRSARTPAQASRPALFMERSIAIRRLVGVDSPGPPPCRPLTLFPHLSFTTVLDTGCPSIAGRNRCMYIGRRPGNARRLRIQYQAVDFLCRTSECDAPVLSHFRDSLGRRGVVLVSGFKGTFKNGLVSRAVMYCATPSPPYTKHFRAPRTHVCLARREDKQGDSPCARHEPWRF